jgi:hypothetical protein
VANRDRFYQGSVKQGPAGSTLDPTVATACATAGAATINAPAGVVTSESITTAAAATYTLTVSNPQVAATDIVFASVQNGTNSAGLAHIATVTPAAGSLVVIVRNAHASAAFNGTVKVAFVVFKGG